MTSEGVKTGMPAKQRRAQTCNEQIRRAAYTISQASCVVALTGSGISAESGLPTFCGDQGPRAKCKAQQFASFEAFQANPKKVWQWYNQRRKQVAHATPNAAHHALCQLAKFCRHFVLITQNCDGLHSKAGSRNVVELHGNIWCITCTKCDYHRNAENEMLSDEPRCPNCHAYLRPCVVWFGESLPAESFQICMEATECCGTLLAIGTSASVQPAASLIWQAKACGASLIEINTQNTAASSLADIKLTGQAGTFLPAIVESIHAIRQNKQH